MCLRGSLRSCCDRQRRWSSTNILETKTETTAKVKAKAKAKVIVREGEAMVEHCFILSYFDGGWGRSGT